MGTKFHCLTIMDLFVDTGIRAFRIKNNITEMKKYFVGILKLMDCLTNKWHTIKSTTKKKKFTVLQTAEIIWRVNAFLKIILTNKCVQRYFSEFQSSYKWIKHFLSVTIFDTIVSEYPLTEVLIIMTEGFFVSTCNCQGCLL